MNDTYSIMRHFADSWALLVLFLFFVGAILWAWRPGSRPLHDDAAHSIFSPEAERLLPAAASGRTCDGTRRNKAE
ncbi:cbb3-type cytochrome c oxidase subunit 3 [Tropicimonas sp. IMCC34011]|uniref:cbb3-type cytochrome c oxidase subunit 3 n=1 Tax=Tropicimonas sp. IMCC34011 TaxID=2248759 RepID=UPI000E260B68|nr:cbb3-type cytochrome c oxidase subunit 3 [Tropicimonas sp. IMCC34011]